MGFFLAVLINLILALAYPFDHHRDLTNKPREYSPLTREYSNLPSLLPSASETLSPGNPFIYVSFMAALFHLYFSSTDWYTFRSFSPINLTKSDQSFPLRHSFGLAFTSQLGIFAAMISSTLLLIALFGLLPTLYLLGLLQVHHPC